MDTVKYINRKLGSNLEAMFGDEFADKFFKCEDSDKEIPAHKCILAASCDKFKASFKKEWDEKVVLIKDAKREEFETFIKTFYYVEIAVTIKDIGDILKFALPYFAYDQIKICLPLLITNLTIENVCYMLYQCIRATSVCENTDSLRFEHDELRKLCELVISENATKVFTTNDFSQCDDTVLSHILKLHSLRCSEMEVFLACVKWAQNHRSEDTKTFIEIIGETIHDIRFGILTISEVERIALLHNELFPCTESAQIIAMIGTRSAETTKNKDQPRKQHWDAFPSIKIEPECGNPPGCGQYELREIETATFSTNAVLILRSILFAEVYECDPFLDSMDEVVIENISLKIIEYHG